MEHNLSLLRLAYEEFHTAVLRLGHAIRCLHQWSGVAEKMESEGSTDTSAPQVSDNGEHATARQFQVRSSGPDAIGVTADDDMATSRCVVVRCIIVKDGKPLCRDPRAAAFKEDGCDPIDEKHALGRLDRGAGFARVRRRRSLKECGEKVSQSQDDIIPQYCEGSVHNVPIPPIADFGALVEKHANDPTDSSIRVF